MANASQGNNTHGDHLDERLTPRRATPHGTPKKPREGRTPKPISTSSRLRPQQTVSADTDPQHASGSGKALTDSCLCRSLSADHGVTGGLRTNGQEEAH